MENSRYKIVTNEETKVVIWAEFNTVLEFQKIMQYIMDNMKEPEKFLLWDTKTDLICNAYKLATENYKMYKRTFEERIENIFTGIFTEIIDSVEIVL